MKKIICFLFLIAFLMANPALAQKGQPHDPNPSKDADVQKGYDEHQKWYKEKQEREEQQKRVEEGKKQGQRDVEDYYRTLEEQQRKK